MPNRPRIQRKPDSRLWVTMPYDPVTRNRDWMQEVLGGRKDLQWNKPMKRWEVARRHLRTLAAALAERFGEVEVLLEFSTTEQCTASCQNAGNQVWECTCKCVGEYHGGRGEKRDWVQAGPHRLIAKNEKLVHFVVLRGEIPAPKPPAPPSAPVLPQPSPPTPAMPPARRPAPPSPRPTPAAPEPIPAKPARTSELSAAADGELQPGCGIAAFVFTFAVFSLLALGISPWWWIGSVMALLVGLAAFIDDRGRL